MKPLVLYHTKYNTTKMVAEVIANHFKIDDIININDFDQANITNYDTLFLGSNVLAMQIGGHARRGSDVHKQIRERSLAAIAAGSVQPD